MIEGKPKVTNSDERRKARQAKAIGIIKAYRPVGHPDLIAALPLPYTDLPGSDPDAPGLVYFLYCGGYIKIGYTTDIRQRLNDFHTHSPMPVTLLLTIRGRPEDELSYHEMFGADRVRREWFHLSLDLRDFLGRHFKPGTSELLWNAEDEALEMFNSAAAFWNQVALETEGDVP